MSCLVSIDVVTLHVACWGVGMLRVAQRCVFVTLEGKHKLAQEKAK